MNQLPEPIPVAGDRSRPSRKAIVLFTLAALLVLAAVARLLIGETIGIPGWTVFQLRAQRLVIGISVGAALAVSGAMLQSLLRNPLASPYILGISSGAALGVMISTLLSAFGVLGTAAAVALGADHTAAVVGALATMAVVYILGQKRGWVDPIGLLLVGVIVNSVNGAAIMFINYMTPHGLRPELALWMMGYFNDNAGWSAILVVLAITIVGTGIGIALGRAMDVAGFSDPEAQSLGLNLRLLRLGLFALAGLLTAGTVVLAGPIGFVGLICPHLVRLLMGPAHRPLVLGSALAGATLIVAADTIIKLADIGQGLMPVGVLTALIGGPVFLWMLRHQLGRSVNP
jgi:iron complex transport system permease protein